MLDIFAHAAVIWFIIGFVLFLLEFVVPGLILFFFAAGAWIVALLCLFFDIPVNAQLIVFVIASVASIFLLRDWTKKLLYGKPKSNAILEDEFLGKMAIAETDIVPGRTGKVDFKGTSWQAVSNDPINAGESVIITGNDSIVLTVKSKQ